MKTKTCSFCGKESERLWYSNPKCCPSYACRKAYNELKSKKGTNTSLSTKVSKIKPISDKKAKELSVYRKLRDEYMKKHPVCEYPGCHSTNITLHHMAGRIGLNLINIGNFKSLCMAHHRWVEEHPVEAKEMGLSINRL